MSKDKAKIDGGLAAFIATITFAVGALIGATGEGKKQAMFWRAEGTMRYYNGLHERTPNSALLKDMNKNGENDLEIISRDGKKTILYNMGGNKFYSLDLIKEKEKKKLEDSLGEKYSK